MAQAARGVQHRAGPGRHNLAAFGKRDYFVAFIVQDQHLLGPGARPRGGHGKRIGRPAGTASVARAPFPEAGLS